MQESATSRDGTRIGWERVGQGPGLVVLHGGTRMGKHYREMAQGLAGSFTLYLVDRRGRGASGPVLPGQGMQEEVEDVAAVMQATGASLVFGHSAGAVVALEAARVLPITALCLYEPPVPAALVVPMGWMAALKQALERKDIPAAMVAFMDGLEMGPPAWIPRWFIKLGMRAMMLKEDGGELAGLLGTLPREMEMALALGPDIQRYAGITCPVLLMGGTASPAFLARALDLAQKVLPNCTRVALPDVGHNAPDLQAPAAVAAQALQFLTVQGAGSAAKPG